MGDLTRAGRLASTVAVAILGTAACSFSIELGGDATGSAEPSPEVTTGEPVPVGAFDLDVGDCVAEGLPEEDAADVVEVDTLPCDSPHGGEVYALLDLAGDAYPGDDGVGQQADEACLARFASFVGIPWERSRLEFWTYLPTRESWASGDREVACLVSDPAGPMTGSAAGLGEAAALPTAGSCLDEAGITVDCATEHETEVYATVEMADGAWPGEDALSVATEDGCLEEFEAYVGLPYEESVLELVSYQPTEETWAEGDRQVLCGVMHPQGSLTGSVRGTAQ